MSTEIKVAALSLVAAVVGAAVGGIASYVAADRAAQASVAASQQAADASIAAAREAAKAAIDVAKRETGAEWDLKRTESVLEAARTDFKEDKVPGYAAWVCYHSILWDCANQEWSVTNDGRDDLARLCPPKQPIEYKTQCPVRQQDRK